MVLARAFLVGLLISSVCMPATAQSAQQIAIWRLKPLGLDHTTAGRLEVLLRAETSRLEGFALQKKDLTESILARSKNARLRQCGGETACLCTIGKTLGVRKLVTGVIGALGDDYTFDLKLIDIAVCREERRINEALSGREDLLIGAIRQALYKLVVPRQFVGSIAVEVPVDGAEVLLDGKPFGVTPLKQPIADLRPGNHKLQIRRKGYSDFEDSVPVRFQQTTRVKVDLVTSVLLGLSYEQETQKEKPASKPPPPRVVVKHRRDATTRILAWSSMGLSAAGVVLGVIGGWRSNVAEDELEKLARAGELYPDSGQPVIDRGRKWSMLSNIGWGVAGGAAVLSAVLFLMDVFAGDDETSPQVSPSVSPEGMGLVLRWPF